MDVLEDGPALAPMVGTPAEVRRRLDRSTAPQVVALPLTLADAKQAEALAETLAALACYIGSTLSRQDERTLRALVDAVVPKAPPTPTLMREAAAIAKLRTAVLGEAEWLTAAQVAQIAGLSATNPSAQPNKWKRQRQIFAIDLNGVDYFPGFGLDPMAGYRPRRALSQVLDIFGGEKDGWGAAYWFLSANSLLGGRRPMDVLPLEPDRVIEAARDEMEPIAHG